MEQHILKEKNTYEGGKRIYTATTKTITTQSDDLNTLGELYRRLSQLRNKLEEVWRGKYPGKQNDIDTLNREIKATEDAVALMHKYLGGYDEQEVQHGDK